MSKNTTWQIEGLKKFNKLKENIETDVVIVGGGLAGFWSAYLLSKTGKKVIVIDCGRVGQGATLYTTAWLTQSIDTDLSELIDIYGKRTAKLAWEAGSEAIDQVESVIKLENIECEFERAN